MRIRTKLFLAYLALIGVAALLVGLLMPTLVQRAVIRAERVRLGRQAQQVAANLMRFQRRGGPDRPPPSPRLRPSSTMTPWCWSTRPARWSGVPCRNFRSSACPLNGFWRRPSTPASSASR